MLWTWPRSEEREWVLGPLMVAPMSYVDLKKWQCPPGGWLGLNHPCMCMFKSERNGFFCGFK